MPGALQVKSQLLRVEARRLTRTTRSWSVPVASPESICWAGCWWPPHRSTTMARLSAAEWAS